VGEYLNQLLTWLKAHELAGTWADVSGFLIAIVGFWATIVGVRKSKNAAVRAQEAAQATRDSIRLIDTIGDFSSAITLLEDIKRANREPEISKTLPERYSAIRTKLIVLRGSSVSLREDDHAVIQNAIANLSTMEEQIEKALASKGVFPTVKYNTLLSRDIDKLVDVFTYLKANQEARDEP
jgi:hypothetical protein